MTVNHLIATLSAAAATTPDAPLLILGEASVSHARFWADVRRTAGALAAAGVGPGDRVVVQTEKSAAALTLIVAAIHAGAIVLPLNPAYTAAEVAYFVADAEPALVVLDPANAASGALTLDRTGAGSFADAVAAAAEADPVPRGADDLAALLYTSGTTGRSKGAMLSHENLASNARALVAAWRWRGDDVLLHALPIFHTHGLFVAVNVSLVAGAAMMFHAAFDAGAVVAALPRATALMGVPTYYTRLLDRADFTREVAAGVRVFISGSAPLLAETHVRFAERTGHAILERYGMTETGMNTSNPYDGERRAGTVGLPLPGVEVRIEGAGQALPPGEIGAVEVRGANVFRGYWRMPEKTAEDIGPDGWFVTGDVGVMSDDGYLTLVGRAKDLVITGGLNVYPKEVEDAIDAVPGVVESAVFGVFHPDFGEAVAAAVVGSAGEAEILAALSDRLARFKQPKRVFALAELPRNAMGKVQKAALRQRFADTFLPGA